MRCGLSVVLLVVLGAPQVWAQEIPDAVLKDVKAPPTLPAALKKPPAKPVKAKAPAVVPAGASWWARRSLRSRIFVAGGALSVALGGGVAAFAASMANNAIDRRQQLQQMEVLDDVQRSEFTTTGEEAKLGRMLHTVGVVLMGTGSLIFGLGGVL